MKRLILPTLVGLVFATATSTQSPGSPTRTPTVSLNHFFVVLDAKSYTAMQGDPYLVSVFAPFEKRTTVRNDDTYTAVYWYGRETYFEIFEPPAQGPQGASGVAFSVDGEGESEGVAALWKVSLGGVSQAPVTRKTESSEPVWFRMTAGSGASGGDSFLRLWLMEYDKDFLARWYPDLTPARGKTRGEVLDRYVAKIGKTASRETAVFGNVKELTLALSETERKSLMDHLTALGWAVSRGATPGVSTLRGPGGVLLGSIAAEGNRRGIVEAVFSVQGKPAAHSASLGAVQLTVNADEARIRFVP